MFFMQRKWSAKTTKLVSQSSCLENVRYFGVDFLVFGPIQGNPDSGIREIVCLWEPETLALES